MNTRTSLFNAVLLLATVAFITACQSGGTESPAATNTNTEAAAAEPSAATSAPSTTEAAGSNGFTFAVLNMDSVQEDLEMMKVLAKELKQKETQAIRRQEAAQRKIQEDALELQQAVQSGALTSSVVAIREEELYKRSERLQAQFAQEEEALYKLQDKSNKLLRNALDSFLRRYNDEKGYDLILRYGTISEVLQYDGAVEITRDVIDGMNAEYAAEQAAMEAETNNK